jgi:hypothetical protein
VKPSHPTSHGFLTSWLFLDIRDFIMCNLLLAYTGQGLEKKTYIKQGKLKKIAGMKIQNKNSTIVASRALLPGRPT